MRNGILFNRVKVSHIIFSDPVSDFVVFGGSGKNQTIFREGFAEHASIKRAPIYIASLSQSGLTDVNGIPIDEFIDEDILPLSISWLILTDNKIKALPQSIGDLTKLQKFPLAGNQLTSLPNTMKNCKNLELLRLSANKLSHIPNWIFELPKLSWLAFSGNDFSFQPQVDLKKASIANLDIKEQLGEGASGMIYKAFSSTLDKVGHEVYSLQRPEISEVNELFLKGTVGSITMPHKRNPELSEHLGTLARLIRHNTNCLNENLVHEHERDGRSWKSEWGLIGTICVMVGAQLHLGYILCSTLQVNSEKMMANIEAAKGHIFSEGIMLALARKIGKQSAHDLVYMVAMTAQKENRSLKSCLADNKKVMEHLSINDIDSLFDYKLQLGLCPQFVDQIIKLTHTSRESDQQYFERYLSK